MTLMTIARTGLVYWLSRWLIYSLIATVLILLIGLFSWSVVVGFIFLTEVLGWGFSLLVALGMLLGFVLMIVDDERGDH